MERHHDYNSHSQRGRVWSFIGFLSFGILGILLGAALVYGLFTLFLVPVAEEVPEAVEEAVEEAVDAVPEADREEQLPPVADPEPSLVEVVEMVMPAVVGVNSHFYVTRFDQEQLSEVETGSGVIVSEDGFIITNQHVIENADKLSVVIPGRGRYQAELVGADALTDLALLKIEESGLTYISLGDSEEIKVGESVLAIGNPLGLQQTVTAGIISALERQIWLPGTEYAYTFIQTDALVNPGNSGGPLVNLRGELVGINTAKVALMGVEGIGLAIPSNTVKRVADDIWQHGRVLRPHMGVLIENWLDYEDQQPELGVLLVEVVPGSPADSAGLTQGDIIVAIDDRPVNFLAQLFDKLLHYYPGDTVMITFYREGEKTEVPLILGERPDQLPAETEEEQDQ